ncbi:MAG: creatininase family protein [Desulfurococcales archaeon]|nr:creatininase family protein [Desulfurococcales archaeon]
MTQPYRWELMTWEAVGEISNKANTLIILPIGSIEQHGPHLPVGTDFLIADKVAERLATELRKRDIYAVKLPPIPFGLSVMWRAYPGTITLSYETLIKLICDVLTSVITSGFHNVLILNAHSGNSDALRVAAREVVEQVGKGKVAVATVWEFVGDVIKSVFETPFFHADEVETSVALALGIPVTKKPGRSPPVFRKYSNRWHSLDLTERPKAYVFRSESRVMHGPGAFGQPDKASRSKGEVLLTELISRLANFVADFLKDEI